MSHKSIYLAFINCGDGQNSTLLASLLGCEFVFRSPSPSSTDDSEDNLLLKYPRRLLILSDMETGESNSCLLASTLFQRSYTK